MECQLNSVYNQLFGNTTWTPFYQFDIILFTYFDLDLIIDLFNKDTWK